MVEQETKILSFYSYFVISGHAWHPWKCLNSVCIHAWAGQTKSHPLCSGQNNSIVVQARANVYAKHPNFTYEHLHSKAWEKYIFILATWVILASYVILKKAILNIEAYSFKTKLGTYEFLTKLYYTTKLSRKNTIHWPLQSMFHLDLPLDLRCLPTCRDTRKNEKKLYLFSKPKQNAISCFIDFLPLGKTLQELHIVL